jgi:peptidoglycan hydrolase CwlO-like protein
MKWKVALLSLCVLFLLPKNSLAYDCVETSPAMSEDELKGISDACTAKITDSQNQQTSLTQAINTINSKINLAQAQINQTQAQITTLEKEVTVLDGVLETVSDSMDELTKIYTARVRESYKDMRVTPIDLIFSANSVGDYFNKVKYLNTVKARDQLILAELEKSKNDYNQRKTDKVAKQKEVEALKTKLVTQQKTLAAQQKDKQTLLAQTKNNEKNYQALLSAAKAQIAAMKGYTSGASPLSNQTHCNDWGCYYSQRDTQWFGKTIGSSSEILGEVGCLTTSVAMVASHYGKTLTPADIAGSSDPYYFSTAYMIKNSWSVNGITVNRTDVSISTGKIDEELAAGHPVIVGLYRGPAHFIVIKGKNDQGYIMNDPYMENGYDKAFTDKYAISNITQLDIVRVN